MRRPTAAAVVTLLLIAGCQKPAPSPTPTASATPEALTAVSALARIEPSGEVHVVAPPVGRANEPIKTWLVKEGDAVRKGQVIALMDSEGMIEADLARAEAEVERALAAKAQVEAGPKQGEVRRQEAEIERMRRERSIGLDERDSGIRRAKTAEQTATREWERYKRLLADGAVSQSVYDQKESDYLIKRREREELEQSKQKLDATMQASVESARGELDRISEVRPTDVRLAQAEVDMAHAEVQRVRSDLEKTRVLSPIDGKVLEILTRTGEVPKDGGGLAEIGEVRQMVAIAEVHQQDAGRVKLGMTAVIRSPALSKPVSGRVERLGEQVLRQRIYSNIPGENFDQRIVEVEIALDMQAVPELSRLSNLQAEAIIEVGQP